MSSLLFRKIKGIGLCCPFTQILDAGSLILDNKADVILIFPQIEKILAWTLSSILISPSLRSDAGSSVLD